MNRCFLVYFHETDSFLQAAFYFPERGSGLSRANLYLDGANRRDSALARGESK